MTAFLNQDRQDERALKADFRQDRMEREASPEKDHQKLFSTVLARQNGQDL